MQQILEKGSRRTDRTGTGTLSLFGPQLEFDLQQGFPAVTTKELKFDLVVKELAWFLRGETNISTLGCKIWDQWADECGDVGPIYGRQWRNWDGCDQIVDLIANLVANPTSRRHIVSAWNVPELRYMGLEPCHVLFQCYVTNERQLNLKMYQRSADYFIGVPFNIASYALLVHLLASTALLDVGKLIISFGDVHIYLNHIEQATLQLTREPYPLPQLKLAGSMLGNWSAKLYRYKFWPAIKGIINV